MPLVRGRARGSGAYRCAALRTRAHVLTVCRDVAGQVETEHELRGSEHHLQEAARIAHVGFWKNDLESDRILWSDGTPRIVGLHAEHGAVSLATFRDMIHRDDHAVQPGATSRARRGDGPHDLDYRLVRADGDIR